MPNINLDEQLETFYDLYLLEILDQLA